ncbi:MAG: precorrin-8X methylmutase [Selenomonadaceae bacterium]|nr:precorrin-8X methylmutase [Selenomonadaceae bacterium]MBQ3726672.1 precorrin-8X methylmutase [Selenomonadaceae bacterium]MBQ9497291.1 precorrin-8X methylmutase [Selenomonadaceae bacterium]
MFITKPMEIEDRSMEIIAPHLAGLALTDEERKIYSRIIHASGDVNYAPIIRIHPEAIAATKAALKRGGNIFTDVEMVRRGISIRTFTKFGGEIFCKVSDVDVREFAKREGITRSMAAMRMFGKRLNGEIVAIGNAPTALFEVLRLVREENIKPAVIIGVPVGFVGAAEAKAQLAAQDEIPFITVMGSKGGSSIAVAAVNAILYLLDNSRGLSEK